MFHNLLGGLIHFESALVVESFQPNFWITGIGEVKERGGLLAEAHQSLFRSHVDSSVHHRRRGHDVVAHFVLRNHFGEMLSARPQAA